MVKSRRAISKKSFKQNTPEEIFFKLFRSSSLAIGIGDAGTGRLYNVNNRFADLFGYQREEMIGKTVEELGLWVDIKNRKKILQFLRKRGTIKNVETHFRKKSGEVLITLLSMERISIGGKTKPVLVAMVTDITESKRTEEELRATQQRFQAAVNSSSIGVLITDLNGKILEINSAICKITGYSEKELLKKNILEITHAEDLDYNWEMVKKMVKGKLPAFFIEKRYIKKDGTVIWVQNNITPLRDIMGNPTHIISFVQNINKRKQAEELLRSSERKFKDLANLLPTHVFETDLKGTITFVNQTSLAMTGYTQADIDNGLNILSTVSPELREKAAADIQRIIGGEKLGGIEYNVLRKDGSISPVLVYASPILENNLPVGIRGISVDITELKQAEKKLLDYQKKLRSMAVELTLTEERERKDIAVDIHDHISQTLAISRIKLGEYIGNHLKGEDIHALNDVRKLIEEVIQSIRSLTFELSPPVLYELGFVSAIDWLKDQFETKHHLKIKFTDDAQPKSLDIEFSIMLYKILRELLTNVVKYARANKVEISLHRLDDNIRIVVSDNGKGFNPRQLDILSKKSFGLFSIRERLNYLGGTFDIISSPGKGTQATLIAPLKRTGKLEGRRI